MTPIDLELQLRQHGAALRGLARDLTRDAHAADDLVQGTWQCALDKPPAQPGPLGGWLATVLRRLHLQRRRGEAHRAERERTAARPEPTPSTLDQLERKETLRTVMAAVFALDEPYQTTVLLRYFEGLTPGEIAARTDTNVATVKSRLQRGILLLRARLDRALGERQRWTKALCLATGLPLLTTTSILTTGALLMGPTAKLLLGAAATLAVGALVWTLFGSEPAPAPAVPQTLQQTAPSAKVADTSNAADRIEHIPVPETAPVDDRLLHPFAYDLEVHVQDRLGLPVEGARILLAPLGCTLDEVPDRTDANGVVHAHWRGRSASMPVLIATGRDEAKDAMRQLVVASGAPFPVVLGSGGGGQGARLRLVSGSGGGGNITFNISGQANGDLGSALQITGLVLQSDAFADNPRMHEGLHPFAAFGDLQWKQADGEAQGDGIAYLGNIPLLHFTISNTVSFGDEPTVPSSGLPPLPTRLTGIVYGEDGKPCAKCPVIWGDAEDRAKDRTRTDDKGAFAFDNMPEGTFELRAGGGDAGMQHQTVALMKGQTTTCEVQLRREITVRGHAIDADGKPIAGYRVEWVGTETPWFDACTVRDDGSFVLPNLPGGRGTLLLWHKDDEVRLPLLQLAEVLPDNGDTVLQFDAKVGAGRLQLEPLLPDGVDKGAVEVRILQEDSRRGTTLQKQQDSNVFAIAGLAAGWYRLEVGGPGLGWLDAGRQYVDGKGLVDLGRLPLRGAVDVAMHFPPGTRFTPIDDPSGTTVEIYRHRADCDVRIEQVTETLRDRLPLPPGDYFAMWRSPKGAKGVTPFTVQAGRDNAVTCMEWDEQADRADATAPARERR